MARRIESRVGGEAALKIPGSEENRKRKKEGGDYDSLDGGEDDT